MLYSSLDDLFLINLAAYKINSNPDHYSEVITETPSADDCDDYHGDDDVQRYYLQGDDDDDDNGQKPAERQTPANASWSVTVWAAVSTSSVVSCNHAHSYQQQHYHVATSHHHHPSALI